MKDPTKILLVLLWLPLALPAQSLLDQHCDLEVSKTPIPKALEQLSENCGLELVYSGRFFRNEKPVSLQAGDWKVKRILDEILAQAEVGYQEVDGQLVFFLKEKTQPKQHTLSGYVEDAETGERLIAAAIFCPELARGTISNEYGFFSLNLPEGQQKVSVSYLGYREKSEAVELNANRYLTVGLTPALTLAEVIVTPHATKGGLLPSPGNGTKLTADAYPAAPDLGGESDLLRIVQMLPGVQSGADGFGGLNVRGGSSEQNLVLLDGVPVYNPAHMLGILSIFNTSAVKNTQVLKGGIPARYGGRLSSVIDVRTREGNTKKWGAEAGIDFISGKGAVHGPFAKGKGSLLLAGRWALDDFLLGDVASRTFFLDNEEPLDGYRFFDVNAKLSYRLSENDRLYLSYYQGGDEFAGSFEEDDLIETPDGDEIDVETELTNELTWGNEVASLRWNHLFSPRIFSNTTLTYTRYEFLNSIFGTTSAKAEELEDEIDFGLFTSFGSDIEDLSLHSDFEIAYGNNHYLRFGFGATHHLFRPETEYEELTVDDEGDLDTLLIGDIGGSGAATEINALELDFYVEDEFKLGENWHFNLGLRLSAFFSDASFFTPEPRLSARYHLTDRWTFSAAIDRTSQYIHRLSFNEINLPNDVWIPSDFEHNPQRSWQANLGGAVELRPGLNLSVEGFAKTFRDVKSFAFLFEDPLGEEFEYIPSIDGKAYGLEFFLRKTGKRMGGWLSYTLSKADRTLVDKVDELPYTFRYDRRHDLKIFGYYRLSERLQFGCNWVFGSPMPVLYSQPSQDYFYIGTLEGLNPYPFRKLERLAPYHRFDFSAAYSLKGKFMEHTFKLSIYNLYDRDNTAFHQFDAFSEDEKEVKVAMLPSVLGVYYGVKF